MTLMLLPDPDKSGSQEPQEIAELGVVVPCELDTTPLTRKEWEALIKKGLPVLIKDVKAAPAEKKEE